MSFETQILSALSTITDRLNTIAANAKKIFEFPEHTTIDLSEKLPVDVNGTTKFLTLQRIFDFFNPSAPQVFEEILKPNAQGQKSFVVISKPDFVLVSKGRVPQIQSTDTETYDFSYDSATGILVTEIGLDLAENLYVTGFSSKVGSIQQIEATANGQTEFFFSGAPNIIRVLEGRANRLETIDYTRTRFSTNNKIDFVNGVDLGTIVTIVKL